MNPAAAQRRKSIEGEIRSKEATMRQTKTPPNASPEQKKQARERRDDVRLEVDQLRKQADQASTIDVARLEAMVHAEVAADKWWHDMSAKEKKAYLAAHPKSKYSRYGAEGQNAYRHVDSHDRASSYHEKKAARHYSIAEKASGRGDQDKYRRHFNAAQLHDKAFNAHQRAYTAHEDAGSNIRAATAAAVRSVAQRLLRAGLAKLPRQPTPRLRSCRAALLRRT